ncbi:MAG: sulfatase-like hydrolase/transferase, partial [Phycisphaerales bacterium]|nr:sulfatase-like hydrolase/transferase [Phycisphaerales bacterium]
MLSRLAFTLVFTGALLTGCAGTSPEAPPHVILIFADDLGYGDLGVYGQQLIATPELDALAASGVRMTQFYTGAAVCSPARSALLQGRDTGHTWIRRNGEFPADLDVLPRRLRDAGYRTAMFGKWHLGHHPMFLPTRHGFDEWYGIPYSNDMWPY